MKRFYAVLIFLVAAFFGAGTQSDLYGNISGFLTFLIVAISFAFMWFAVGLWKSAKHRETLNKKQNL